MVLRGIEVYAKFFERWLEVDSSLQVRDVESFADTLDVGAQKRIRRAENPLNRSGQLLARCNSKQWLQQIRLIVILSFMKFRNFIFWRWEEISYFFFFSTFSSFYYSIILWNFETFWLWEKISRICSNFPRSFKILFLNKTFISLLNVSYLDYMISWSSKELKCNKN